MLRDRIRAFFDRLFGYEIILGDVDPKEIEQSNGELHANAHLAIAIEEVSKAYSDLPTDHPGERPLRRALEHLGGVAGRPLMGPHREYVPQGNLGCPELVEAGSRFTYVKAVRDAARLAHMEKYAAEQGICPSCHRIAMWCPCKKFHTPGNTPECFLDGVDCMVCNQGKHFK
jgi:hypothetical protein